MSEPRGGPMCRQRTSGQCHPTPALLPAAPQASYTTPLPGHLCEQCLDAPAVTVMAAPWGGEMGVCAACAGLASAMPAVHQVGVSACLICTAPPGPDEDATAYVQHCFDTGHPLQRGEWQIQRGTRIYL
jgi:hypothetical protein